MLPIPCCSAVVCRLVLAVSATLSTSYAGEPTVQTFGDWTVTIQPGVRGSAATDRGSPTGLPVIRFASQEAETKADPATPPAELPQIIPEPPAPAGTVVNAAPDPNATRTIDPLALVGLYPQVYDSIPFSRAEYEANPSYRHDATMEFLFGQMRSTVIHRGTGGGGNRYGGMPYGGGGQPYSPYGFNSFFFPFYYFPDQFMGPYVPYNLW